MNNRQLPPGITTISSLFYFHFTTTIHSLCPPVKSGKNEQVTLSPNRNNVQTLITIKKPKRISSKEFLFPLYIFLPSARMLPAFPNTDTEPTVPDTTHNATFLSLSPHSTNPPFSTPFLGLLFFGFFFFF